MKRIVPMLLTVIMVSVFLSSCKKSNPISSYIPSSSFKPSSSAESTENSKTPIHEMLDKDDILGGIGRIYTIDKNYIEEMNRNRHVSNAERGEITYRFTQQWQEKMVYYYDILYEALNEEGKKVLKSSQEYWQDMFESDIELNGIVQAQNLIIYDVFDNPKYSAYRSRAIVLSIKCSSMNSLYDMESGNPLYRELV